MHLSDKKCIDFVKLIYNRRENFQNLLDIYKILSVLTLNVEFPLRVRQDFAYFHNVMAKIDEFQEDSISFTLKSSFIYTYKLRLSSFTIKGHNLPKQHACFVANGSLHCYIK